MTTCARPGCGTLTRGRWCKQHAAEENAARDEARKDDPARRIRSSAAWKRVRALRLALAGHRCEAIELRRRCDVREGLDVHHVVAIEDGGEPFDVENTEALCRTHHARRQADRKTAA